MTLDEMIQQCATDIDEVLSKSNGVYAGAALVMANKIVTGLNYAYQKIAREKHMLTQEDVITLGTGGTFSTTTLTRPMVEIFNVYDKYKEPIFWTTRNQTMVTCPDESEGDQVTAEYSWLPDKLLIANLAVSPLFPEADVDHLIMCYYANYYVLSLDPDNETREKAATNLNLFNDGFENIRQKISLNLTMRVE